jgi:hypothetical protein
MLQAFEHKKVCKKFKLLNLYGSDNLEDVVADGM